MPHGHSAGRYEKPPLMALSAARSQTAARTFETDVSLRCPPHGICATPLRPLPSGQPYESSKRTCGSLSCPNLPASRAARKDGVVGLGDERRVERPTIASRSVRGQCGFGACASSIGYGHYGACHSPPGPEPGPRSTKNIYSLGSCGGQRISLDTLTADDKQTIWPAMNGLSLRGFCRWRVGP